MILSSDWMDSETCNKCLLTLVRNPRSGVTSAVSNKVVYCSLIKKKKKEKSAVHEDHCI